MDVRKRTFLVLQQYEMAAIEAAKKEFDYGNVHISLENCILPDEKLSETASMKDGLDKETETDLRVLGCEFIQTAGILLKLPQVAMATGQILLQRFYYSKSLVKHDVEICAMACIFLAAKIEESPRRLRDVINVFHHIKQKRSKRPIVPMDYFSNAYFSLKNNIIKAERRVLKELGFCVHVKHPHKVIITYLQILDHEKNAPLAQRAWNYMNDSLRTDVFLKYAPEKIGCACIFLAARHLKVVLPQRPPWWELFDADLDDIEDISLTILKLYARPKVRMSKLDEAIENAKKLLQEKKDVTKENGSSATSGSFTPAHVSPNVTSAGGNTLSTKTSSKTVSPAKISPAGRSNESSKKSSRDSEDPKRSQKRWRDEDGRDGRKKQGGRSRSPSRRKNRKGDHDSSDDTGSDSSPERRRKPKKVSRPRNSSSSSDSEDDSRTVKAKDRRIDRENGHRTYNYDRRYEARSKSRSRSRSRERRDKRLEKRREKERKRDEKERFNDYRNNYDRYDKKNRR